MNWHGKEIAQCMQSVHRAENGFLSKQVKKVKAVNELSGASRVTRRSDHSKTNNSVKK